MSEDRGKLDEIDGQAAEWTARLALGTLRWGQARALRRWLAADVRHGVALAEAQRTWELLGLLPERPDMRVAPAAPARVTRRWAPVAAWAVCVMVLLGGAGIWFGDPLTLLRADDRAEPGQVRTLRLADGSMVELGPASAVAMRFSGTERRVVLLSGEAYFTASPMGQGEARPFVVAAAQGTARALGTQFMVEILPGGAEVTVAEHRVSVAVVDGKAGEVTLSPGQSVRYAGAGLGPVRSVDLDRATAWRRGRLIFDQKPLSEVVAELNRYRYGRIVITDGALASRRVSGVFDTREADAALATITRVLGIRTVSLPLVTLLF